MIVFAFDRDWTVDVNPHPTKEAVPLEWVRTFAHETEHAVYAIGNQDLADEAAITGVVDIVGRHDDPWDVWLGDKQPDGRYERFPSRHERLSLISDLHPESEDYIVVDDLDLCDVDGWDHYHAWEFVDAVRDGAVDIDALPSTSLRSDGGFGTKEDVESVLENGYLFELTYRDDGRDRTFLVTHREPHRPSMVPLHGPPTFLFDAIAGGETHEVRLPDLIDLTPVSFDQLPEPVTTQALSALVEAVENDDERISDETIRQGIEQARTADGFTLQGLKLALELLQNRDDALVLCGVDIVSLLTDAKSKFGLVIFDEILAQARESPDQLEPAVSELATIAASESPYRKPATECLMEVAAANPTAALDAVPALATAATADDEGTRSFAVYALAQIADEYPEEVYPAVDALIESIGADDETLRTNALSTLGQIAGSYPDAATEIVDELVAMLDDEAKRVRNNVVGLLGDIAQEHPGVVIDHAEAIAKRLTDRNIQARINASIALLEAGEADPDAVAAQHELLEEALTDASPDVRANVCVLIGNAETPVSVEQLRDLKENDPDETVRDRAAFAVQRLS